MVITYLILICLNSHIVVTFSWSTGKRNLFCSFSCLSSLALVLHNLEEKCRIDFQLILLGMLSLEHHSHDRLNEAQKVCAPASQLRKRQEMGKGVRDTEGEREKRGKDF